MTGRVVELAGLAGAGKTTLAETLRSRDTDAVVGVDAGRLRLLAGLAAVTPVLAAARATAPGRWWTTAELRSLAYLRAWRRPLADRRDDTLVLLDHGPVFRLSALAAHGPPMARTPTFRRWWTGVARQWSGLLDVVVWLDAPEDVLVQRINGREREHRVRGARRHDAEAFLAAYRNAFDSALEVMAREGTPVVRIDTSTRTPAELADIVQASVVDQITGRSR